MSTDPDELKETAKGPSPAQEVEAAEVTHRREDLADRLSRQQERLAQQLAAQAEVEAGRIATQRREDLQKVAEDELRRAREAGQREAEARAHTAEQDARIADLKVLLTRTSSDLELIKTRLISLEEAFNKFVAVFDAVAQKSVSNRALILAVLAILVPIVALFLSVSTGK